MRLLYVAVTLISALVGFMAIEAKPTAAKASAKAVRPVAQAKESVARSQSLSPNQTEACCTDESCCPGNSPCTGKSCGAGKSCCKGK